MKQFILLAALLVTVSCSNGPQSTPSEIINVKSNLKKCENGQDVKFEWEWCADNEINNSNVNEVCFGSLIFTDMVSFAVQLKSNLNGEETYQCLFSHGPWDEVTSSHCNRTIEREYMAAYGEKNIVKIQECLDNDGLRFRIDGVSLLGDKFSSTKIK